MAAWIYALLLLYTPAQATTVYRCVDAQGVVTYSDRQCGKAKPQELKPPPKAGLDKLGTPAPVNNTGARGPRVNIPSPTSPAPQTTRPAKRGPY